MELDVIAEEAKLRESFDALAEENARLRTKIQTNIQRQYELRGAFALLVRMKLRTVSPTNEPEVSDG